VYHAIKEKLRHELRHPGRALDLKTKDLIGGLSFYFATFLSINLISSFCTEFQLSALISSFCIQKISSFCTVWD